VLRKDVNDKVNKSLARIEDVNNKLNSTDNYLARYLPFNNFCMSMECSKMVFADYVKNKKLKENVENYEKWKIKDLYDLILFDDGLAPKHFEKDMLVRDREDINELIKGEVRLTSKNLRGLKHNKNKNPLKGSDGRDNSSSPVRK